MRGEGQCDQGTYSWQAAVWLPIPSIPWRSLLLRCDVLSRQRARLGTRSARLECAHSPAQLSYNRHARRHMFFVVPSKVGDPGRPSHHVSDHHLRMGCGVPCQKKTGQDVNSNWVFCLGLFPRPVSAPQGQSIIGLNLLELL